MYEVSAREAKPVVQRASCGATRATATLAAKSMHIHNRSVKCGKVERFRDSRRRVDPLREPLHGHGGWGLEHEEVTDREKDEVALRKKALAESARDEKEATDAMRPAPMLRGGAGV